MLAASSADKTAPSLVLYKISQLKGMDKTVEFFVPTSAEVEMQKASQPCR